jgi:molecular chaperone DnaK (HSP70)
MTTIAIDFGTSNTIVSLINPLTQKPETLRLEGLSTPMGLLFSVPTIVFIQPDRVLIGAPVREQRLGFSQPDRYFANFKRDLIAVYQPPDRLIDGQSYSAAWVAELFLTQLWAQITAQVTPTQVILTVPIGAFEHYLDWFRGVATRLNFPQPMWVDESTAAALGYAVNQPDQICLVIDCGGGTIDLSLVKTRAAQPNQQPSQPQLKAQVLAKSDAYIGGADIDIWIVEDYLRQQGIDRSTVSAISWQNLLEISERLKIQLSQVIQAKDSWFDDENFMAYELDYSRSQLEVILENQQFLEQLRQSIDEVLVLAIDKGIRKSDINVVLLVGGSAQIPAIQQLLRLYFGVAKLKCDQPLEAVAYGALALTKLTPIEDELRHAYAIQLWDPQQKRYIFYPIFAKGNAYPCVSPPPLMILQAAIAGQTEIRLDIGELADIRQAVIEYDRQGQVSTTHLNPTQAFRSLPATGQTCIARLSPAGQLGVDRITVEFAVTADRRLVVTVQDLLTQERLLDRQVVAQL